MKTIISVAIFFLLSISEANATLVPMDVDTVCTKNCETVSFTTSSMHTVTYTEERITTKVEEHHEVIDFTFVTNYKRPRKTWPGYCYINLPPNSSLNGAIAKQVGFLGNGYQIYYTTDKNLCRKFNKKPSTNSSRYAISSHFQRVHDWTSTTTISEFITFTDTYYTYDTVTYMICTSICNYHMCHIDPSIDPPTAPVPEPGTLLLFGTGLLSCLGAHKLRRRG